MKIIHKILLGILIWVFGTSIISTSGKDIIVGLAILLAGMPSLFIIDASFIVTSTVSSVLTLIILLWIIGGDKLKEFALSQEGGKKK